MGLIGALGLEERLPTSVWPQLRPGGWAIDVGANVGLVTAQLCERVGQSGTVWAVEPIPRNAERLRQLRSDNDLVQLSVLEGALGDTSSTASIRLPAGGESGWASFTKSWDTGGELPVKTWRLDDLHDTFPPQPLDFVKIDVEGYEPQVVQGASSTLTTFWPLVMCELNDILLRDAGSSSAGVVRQFGALGYRRVDKPRPRSHSTIEDAIFVPEDRSARRG
jgi:FkbM family methyltransferase